MSTSVSKTRTQVLVVGAGPVGLLAALRLLEQGVAVRVVDQQPERRVQTFPVVLHPQSLRLLNALGLAAALFWRGRPITRLAVYTEYERRAVLDLPKASGVSPGALTLPQDVLRQALANAVSQRGVDIEYDTRLAVLQQDEHSVWGRLVEHEAASLLLGGAGRQDVRAFEADYVIGADGFDSSVREALGIPLLQLGALESYAFFDATTQRSGSEAQLAISEDFCNAVYPVQGGLSRFSFQLGPGLNQFPDVATLRDLMSTRLPWYGEQLESCEWSGIAEFRHALASRFGRGRVWLAGDAAHLTGPLGVQSLNVGLDEASELGLSIGDQLRNPQPLFGESYDQRRQQQWRELLGAEDRVAPSSRCPAWARRHLPRLMSSLPASEADLDDLLDQLRLAPSSGRPRSDAPTT